MELKNRSFLKLLDYTPAEIGQLLELAADLKAKKKAGIRHDQLRGKNIALIFEKTSTRTRCSFEVAVRHCRGGVLRRQVPRQRFQHCGAVHVRARRCPADPL